jgi:uncharacterized membrane protein YvlD (DUF360 family)
MSGALFQELPYFQQHLPEGLCLASRMTMSANSGLILAFLYYLYNRYVRPVPNVVAIPFLIVLVSFAMMACSVWFDLTYDGTSFALYFFMFLAGCVGNLMYQILYPFLVNYR